MAWYGEAMATWRLPDLMSPSTGSDELAAPEPLQSLRQIMIPQIAQMQLLAFCQ
jgi:hypothetical protein